MIIYDMDPKCITFQYKAHSMTVIFCFSKIFGASLLDISNILALFLNNYEICCLYVYKSAIFLEHTNVNKIISYF